jgi:hypothetical protein
VPGEVVVPSSCGTLVPFLPKCVPVHENCSTTRGTLLVLKMCMELVYTPLELEVLTVESLL